MIIHIQSLFSDIHYSKNFDRIWCSCIPWYILLNSTEPSLYLVNAICDIWHCCIKIYVVSFCDWNKHVNEKFWFNILKIKIVYHIPWEVSINIQILIPKYALLQTNCCVTCEHAVANYHLFSKISDLVHICCTFSIYMKLVMLESKFVYRFVI